MRLGPLKLARRVDEFLERFDDGLVEEAKTMGADVLIFNDRPWMGEPIQLAHHDDLSIALLSFNGYEDWFSSLPRRKRKDIRNAGEEGVEILPIIKPSASEANEIVDLYRESPFREGRYFIAYDSWTSRRAMEKFRTDDKVVSNVAVYRGKIVGAARATFKEEVAVSNSILSSLALRARVRGVPALLLAAHVRALSSRGVRYLKYGHIGLGLDSLDHWKLSHGFRPVRVSYNYVLLTRKARVCARFGLHRPREMVFSTTLRFATPSLGLIQRHLPLRMIQKFHLYA